MHPADTSSIDEALAAYHRCYPTSYAFYNDADGVIGNHEEAILRAQADESALCGLMKSALPTGAPPEKISAEEFYGGMYFWPKRTLVFARARTTKRPMPIYYAATNKPLSREDYQHFEAHYETHDKNKNCASEKDERYGYASMFMESIWCDWTVMELNETFHRIERFMCDDIMRCTIYDWRSDLAPHCLEEHEYGGCGGNYLWTLSCPVKRRLTLIRWHFNWYYA